MADASSILQIILQLKDEASTALADSAKASTEALGNLGKQAIAIGAPLAAVGGVITGGLVYALKEAELHQKNLSQLDAVLKSTAGAAGLAKDAILAQGEALAKVTQYDNDAILQGQNMLLTFTNIKGTIAEQATPALLDLASAMGTDVKDSAIQLGKALNDPVMGMTALRRVGVTFSKDQAEVVKKLVETGQVAKAQQLILDELTKEFGGSAKAQLDPWVKFKQAIDDTFKALGKELLPIVNQFLVKAAEVATRVIDWTEKHPALTKTILIVVGALGLLLTVVGGALVTFGAFALAISAIGTALSISAGAVLIAAGVITATIIALGIIAVLIIKYHREIWEFVSKIWNDIVNWIKGHWEMIVNVLLPGLGFLVAFMIKNWNQIKTDVVAVWNAIADFFIAVWDNIKKTFNDAFAFVMNIVDKISSAVDKVRNAVSSVVPSMNQGGSLNPFSPSFQLPHFASGGIVTGPTVAMVGEAGPEAIIPLGGGGFGNNIIINVNGGTYLDQSAARIFGDLIAKTINRQLKLRTV